MEKFLDNVNATFIGVFGLYALAIYGIVEAIKRMTKESAARAIWPILPSLIGGLSAPMVWPFLGRLLEFQEVVPLSVAVFLGVGTGAVASNIYNVVKDRTARPGPPSAE